MIRKFWLRLTCFTGVLGLLHIALSWIVSSESIRTLSRLPTLDQFYKIPDHSIELLVLGSSHAYCSLDPRIIKNKYDINAFNLGTGKQGMLSSFYMLKEVLKTQKPRYVVMEIYYPTSQLEFEEIQNSLGRMKNIKLDTFDFYKNFTFQEKIQNQMPYLNLDKTLNAILIQFTGVTRNPIYWGYEFSADTLSHQSVSQFIQVKEAPVALDSAFKKNTDVLLKIADLCHEAGIQLVMYTAPMLTYPSNYEQVQSFLRAKLGAYGVRYLDWSVGTSRLLFDNRDFRDATHLNHFGAQKMTELIMGSLTERGGF